MLESPKKHQTIKKNMLLLDRSGAHVFGCMTRENNTFGFLVANEEDSWTTKNGIFDTFWGAHFLGPFCYTFRKKGHSVGTGPV